jgi:hypothetical protein
MGIPPWTVSMITVCKARLYFSTVFQKRKPQNSQIFYEGPVNFKPNLPTRTLEELTLGENLVLYSIPRSKERLKSILNIVKPSRVILNYTYIPEYDFEKFVRMFLGNVKFLINNQQGMTTLKQMAKVLNIDEEFVLVFSEYMTRKGYIDFVKAEDNMVFSRGAKEEYIDLRQEKVIKKYLLDKEAYIRYLLKFER